MCVCSLSLTPELDIKKNFIEKWLAPYEVMDDFKLATTLDPHFKLDRCENDESRDGQDLLTSQVV